MAKQSGNIVKRGDRWCIRVRHMGKQIWRSAATKTAAQKILNEIRSRIDSGEMDKPQREPEKTLEEWAPTYLEWAELNKESYKNDKTKIGRWVEFCGELELSKLTKAVVSDYVNMRQKAGLSGATINRDIASLRKCLSLAVERGELEFNQLLGFHHLREAPGRQPSLSKDDEAILLEFAPAWLSWMIQLALKTGCRQGELLALTWRDIDFDNGVIIVGNSKSGESRRLPIPSSMCSELEKRKSGSGKPVIPGPTTEPLTSTTVSSAWGRTRKKADMPHLRFHDLRHVAASRLIAQGASFPEVAAWLGQKTLAMAKRYSHVSWDRLVEMTGSI